MAQERLTVNTFVSAANITGATTDIDDDPDSPDGLWMTSSGGGATQLVGGFQSPSRGLKSGDDLQEFRVLIRRSSANGGPGQGASGVFGSGSGGGGAGQGMPYTATTPYGYSGNGAPGIVIIEYPR